MKKKINLLFCFCIFVCGTLLTGCSSDLEDSNSRSEKTNKLRSQILELADDYDLNLSIDVNKLFNNIDNINIDSVENMIKEFSAIRGSYTFYKYNKNGKIILNQNKKIERTRSESYVKENYIFDEHEADKGPETVTCCCSVNWYLDNGKIESPSVDPSLKLNPIPSTEYTTNSISTWIDNEMIKFMGTVTCHYGFYTLSFNVRGCCNQNGGSIDWY